MIVKINPVVSGLTANKTPAPVQGSADFATSLENAFPSVPKTPEEGGKGTRPIPAKPEEETTERDPQEGLAEAPPVESFVEMPDVQISAEVPSFVDPKQQTLQQLVTQNSQTPPTPALSATPQTVEAATGNGAELSARPLTEAIVPQDAEGQRSSFMLPESMKPKAAAQALTATGEGKPGTDKVATEQHTAFLSQLKPGERMPEEAGAVKPDATTAHPLIAEQRVTPVADVGIRPHIAAAIEQVVSQTPVNSTSQPALNQALGTPAWQQALSQQLSYFSRNGIHNAELRLHPEELGSLQINLRLNNNQAQLHFVAENHQVRAALEAAMPQLRTSLAESGVNLGESSVGADTSSSWAGSSQSDRPSSHSSGGEDPGEHSSASEEQAPVRTNTLHYSNGINTFA
ncbi:flagellar hook-length control protein FliK [Rahnella bruchi]|uniref:flagellar hook-length control protein FliK n=1 Tax=Rahnella bruchi TaxID=1510573 RepID=UPI000EA39EFB|nr:flagellar hook-length control protein FliK [Rahnella bruchi]